MRREFEERTRLYRMYGATLERILDMHNISGDRSLIKKKLHESIKKSKRIIHFSRIKTEDLKTLINELNDFFPL
jgi:hypothetical protein